MSIVKVCSWFMWCCGNAKTQSELCINTQTHFVQFRWFTCMQYRNLLTSCFNLNHKLNHGAFLSNNFWELSNSHVWRNYTYQMIKLPVIIDWEFEFSHVNKESKNSSIMSSLRAFDDKSPHRFLCSKIKYWRWKWFSSFEWKMSRDLSHCLEKFISSISSAYATLPHLPLLLYNVMSC